MNWSAFVGLPWLDRGRGPDGYDCWGLVHAVYAAQGIALPSHAEGYRTAADRDETARIFAAEAATWSRVAERETRAFDVAVLIVTGRLHVGVFVQRGMMLHMPFRQTSVIEPPAARGGRIEGIYRHQLFGG